MRVHPAGWGFMIPCCHFKKQRCSRRSRLINLRASWLQDGPSSAPPASFLLAATGDRKVRQKPRLFRDAQLPPAQMVPLHMQVVVGLLCLQGTFVLSFRDMVIYPCLVTVSYGYSTWSYVGHSWGEMCLSAVSIRSVVFGRKYLLGCWVSYLGTRLQSVGHAKVMRLL